MSASSLINAVNAAVQHRGMDDQVEAAGQFTPRGSTGAMFGGGLVAGTVGDLLPAGLDGVATVGGAIGASRGVAKARNLPPYMLVGVSTNWVYGFAGRSRSREPQQLVFRMPRAGLDVTVHQRVNVRTVTLTGADGSRIELEGNRMPLTHSKDVIDALS
jgi:hypothetical protein